MKFFASMLLSVFASTAMASYSYSPAQIVDAAYNGKLEDIASFGQFCKGEKRPANDAYEIIEAGIFQGLVDADLVDDSYISAVRRLSRLNCLDVS